MTPEAIETALFYALAVLSIVFALAAVNTPRMLRAAVFLMCVLVLSAGYYVMLTAEFLAGVQVLVYVGGIAVVIIFVVMLTSSADLREAPPPLGRRIWAALASLGFLGTTAAVILSTDFHLAAPSEPPADSARAIGLLLLDYGKDGYVLPFEVISLLLLAAIIGGIVIARKNPAPGQPLTSGGDLPGEVTFVQPKSQREKGGKDA